MDNYGNVDAVHGCDRCFCGCKYWVEDVCIDCGTHIDAVRTAELEADEWRDLYRGFEYSQGFIDGQQRDFEAYSEFMREFG